MSDERDQSQDPKGVAFHLTRPSEATGSRLAHWPPPIHESESPSIRVKHKSGEPVKLAKPHGWRLMRALFSEFGDGGDD